MMDRPVLPRAGEETDCGGPATAAAAAPGRGPQPTRGALPGKGAASRVGAAGQARAIAQRPGSCRRLLLCCRARRPWAELDRPGIEGPGRRRSPALLHSVG